MINPKEYTCICCGNDEWTEMHCGDILCTACHIDCSSVAYRTILRRILDGDKPERIEEV
jgi:hypothetical protein